MIVWIKVDRVQKISRTHARHRRKTVPFQFFAPVRAACLAIENMIKLSGVWKRLGLEAVADTRAQALSGGEQQRVAIARALAPAPSILLCDEPTGNLDPERARELLVLLDEIHQRGTTLIVATHDPDVMRFGL